MENVLSTQQILDFETEGFVRLDNAFSKELAAEAREILWKDLPCDPNDATTWTKPVIRLWHYSQPVFEKAANTPSLHGAYNQLVGKGRWIRRGSLGTFPVRFPSEEEPDDTGWHIDGAYMGRDGHWWANVNSKERALLMLFLFSDIGEKDAPTRILVGSHLDVPKLLAPYGEEGLSFIDVAGLFTSETLQRKVSLAMGDAGTVYLCHPFLIHGAQPNHGTKPRFLAQPALMGEIDFIRPDKNYSPVERAIRKGLDLGE